ncbi:MAG: SUMF1/EgtB/PvdO family nonheme iron enzyme [Desulfobacterales bacterium]|nr:SUMF1/EgtB/PvdO family nonheme iron enzyme [Desulfobacterales bacterium]
MLTDMVGFTERTSRMSRKDMMSLLKLHDDLVRPVIMHYKGRVVKTLGDAFLSVFDSPTNAVLCSILTQHVMKVYNKDRGEEEQIHIRIALNTGDVQVSKDGDVFGEPVNVAARLEGVTEEDEIYFTEQVYLTINRNEVPRTLEVKRFNFKGIEGDVKVYKIKQDHEDETYVRIINTKIKTADQKYKPLQQLVPGIRHASASFFERCSGLLKKSGDKLKTALSKKKTKPPEKARPRRLSPLVYIIPLIVVISATAAFFLTGQDDIITDSHDDASVYEVADTTLRDTAKKTGNTVTKKTGNTVGEPQPAVTNSIGMKFIYLPPGKFVMGSPPEEIGRIKDETRHRVTLKTGFFIQPTEVTIGQWRIFARETGFRTEAEKMHGAWIKTDQGWEKRKDYYWDNPGFAQTENHPVTCVSWNDIQLFITWLNKKEGKVYRLPFEAEWEYACRAGTATAFANGPITSVGCGNEPSLDQIGWFCGNANGKTHPVAQKKPNAWGLYDMHGNVWEWCYNWYMKYSSEPESQYADISGPSSGLNRVGRGGGWSNNAWECRSAYRYAGYPGRRSVNLGFRLVMEP